MYTAVGFPPNFDNLEIKFQVYKKNFTQLFDKFSKATVKSCKLTSNQFSKIPAYIALAFATMFSTVRPKWSGIASPGAEIPNPSMQTKFPAYFAQP